jgi:CreA protein
MRDEKPEVLLSMTIRRLARAARFAAAFVLAGTLAGLAGSSLGISPAGAADEPDVIFKRSTVFKWLTPNDKLATYGLDDPEVDGVACHFTVPEKGGLKGWIGVAEEVSDISLACRQIGPIRFKKKFAQGEDVFRARRSLFFKKMQIVRGCDVKRNVLVYMVYSDKIIEGSPKNSTSTVPVMPWGAGDTIEKCADWVE